MVDKRLTLELLEEIVRSTKGGRTTSSDELETRRGWTREQVWQELRRLWEKRLIHAEVVKDLNDPVDKVSLLITGLTAAGWAYYNAMRRPDRSWFAGNWMWAVMAVIAAVAAVLTAL
jgi:hypothetical protein